MYIYIVARSWIHFVQPFIFCYKGKNMKPHTAPIEISFKILLLHFCSPYGPFPSIPTLNTSASDLPIYAWIDDNFQTRLGKHSANPDIVKLKYNELLWGQIYSALYLLDTLWEPHPDILALLKRTSLFDTNQKMDAISPFSQSLIFLNVVKT